MKAAQTYTFGGTTYFRGQEIPDEVAAEYQVSGAASGDAAASAKEDDAQALEDHTVDELKSIAKSLDLEGYSTLNKAGLISLIEEERS